MNEFFGGTNYIPAATLHVGLSTTTPSKAGSNITEPSGNGYARVAVPNNASNFPAASAGSKQNGATIAFPEATGVWGTVTHFVVYDAATNGNALIYGALANSKSIEAGDTPSFSAGGLSFSLAQ